MTNDQLQRVVDAKNKQLNEQSEGEAFRLLDRIRTLTTSINNLIKQREEVQKAVVDLPFDAITLEDAVNGFAPKA